MASLDPSPCGLIRSRTPRAIGGTERLVQIEDMHKVLYSQWVRHGIPCRTRFEKNSQNAEYRLTPDLRYTQAYQALVSASRTPSAVSTSS